MSSKLDQLIFLGAPGSGKGTQAQKLVQNMGYTQLSTGDLLRAEVEKSSQLGQKIQGIMDRGDLVDDMTVLELLEVNVDLDNQSYIFDGFPRNLDQTKLLDEHLLEKALKKALYFEMDLEILIQRIVNRRIANGSGEIYNLISKPPKVPGKCDISGEELVHRKDDNEETVRNRMDVFKENIEPVLEYYEGQGILARIDASLGSDAVYQQIMESIER